MASRAGWEIHPHAPPLLAERKHTIHSVIDGNDMVYEYKLIEGEMPKSGGATALFIDWIGVGGGVGRGFHGVGVGRRGRGIR